VPAAIVAALLVLAIAAEPVAADPVSADPASAASFGVRLEAAVHRGYTFDTAGAITARKTVTVASPVTVTASARRSIPTHGVYLRLASGTLAGWWVHEDALAFVPGIAATTTYTPVRSVSLMIARYELYTFDSSGVMTAARGRRIAVPTTIHVNRAAVIRGRRYVRIADGAWTGWWVPGTVTAPAAITCSAGSPPTGTKARTVRAVGTATGEIALTFDMGGRVTPALDIMRFLELERVCATIFPTGAVAETLTGRAVLAEVRAHPELFELGNHTVHHCNLRDGGGGASCPAARPSATFAKAELTGAGAIIASISGRRTVPYWRPPYGAVDTTLAAVAAAAGYPYTIMWSTDTIDWRPVADGGPTAASMAAKVIAGRRAGGIVLMHLGGYNTRNALPAMVVGLRAAGYNPTTVSALYRWRGAPPGLRGPR
jgi:peptidoglycan/xylan/chitin deacetylase (PgdA/CDA1 family)